METVTLEKQPSAFQLTECKRTSRVEDGIPTQATMQMGRRKKQVAIYRPLTSLFGSERRVLTKVDMEAQRRRFEDCERKRRELIQQKANQLQQKELAMLKSMPTLTPRTLQLCQSSPNDPIYLRFEREKQRHLKQIEEKRERQAEKDKQKLQLQIEEMEKYNKLAAEKKSRDYEEYFTEMVRWKEKRQQYLEAKRGDLQKKQLSSTTFKPEISQRSKKLQKKLPSGQYLESRDPRRPCHRK